VSFQFKVCLEQRRKYEAKDERAQNNVYL